jgi:hypothetical protein
MTAHRLIACLKLAAYLLGKLIDNVFMSARCDWVLPTAVVRGREDAEKWLQLIDDKGQPTAGMTTLDRMY